MGSHMFPKIKHFELISPTQPKNRITFVVSDDGELAQISVFSSESERFPVSYSVISIEKARGIWSRYIKWGWRQMRNVHNSIPQ